MISIGVRCLIYSFIEFKDLILKISKLNKIERKIITESEVLDQPRIVFFQESHYNFNEIEYIIQLCTGFRFNFLSFPEAILIENLRNYIEKSRGHFQVFNLDNDMDVPYVALDFDSISLVTSSDFNNYLLLNYVLEMSPCSNLRLDHMSNYTYENEYVLFEPSKITSLTIDTV